MVTDYQGPNREKTRQCFVRLVPADLKYNLGTAFLFLV